MAAKYLDADVHGLYLLADLIDRYWRGPSTSLAAEIRQHRLAFGLTPIDRRRLQWALTEGPDEASTPKRRQRAARGDPRSLLKAVK